MRIQDNHNYKKLTKEEVSSIVKNGELIRTTRLRIIELILGLNKGEGFILKRKDWPSRVGPDTALRQYPLLKGVKTSVLGLRDKTGWLIIKI